MNIDPYLASVLADLDRATALADEQTRSVAAKVATAVEPALRMALVHALSDAAADITSHLDEATVVVRMEGREPVIVVQGLPPVAPAAPEPPAAPSPEPADDGDTARVTVRLPQSLKQQVETLAVEADQSLNTWIVQALRRAAVPQPQPPTGPPTPRYQHASRLTGWA